jgi:hypothetical protein
LKPLASELDASQATWSRVLADLELQMSPATFDNLLRGTGVVQAHNGTITVAVRHPSALVWLEGRLGPLIQRTVERVAGPDTVVEFSGPGPHLPIPCRGSSSVADTSGVENGSDAACGGGTLVWTDFYIKLKLAFRKRALSTLKGAKLSVFLCLALHVDRHGMSKPGIEAIMRETGYSRGVVCNALDKLEALGLVTKVSTRRGTDEYQIEGYAWFGTRPAASLWEE